MSSGVDRYTPRLRVCMCVLWANSHSVTQLLSVSEPCLLAWWFPAHRCSLLPACLPASLLGGLGQIRADQFRVSLLTQFTEQTVPEDRTASRWTFLSSSGIRNSGDDGKVSAEVSNVLLLLIICARTENPSAAVGRVTFQPNFDAAGCPSLPLSPAPPCSLPPH